MARLTGTSVPQYRNCSDIQAVRAASASMMAAMGTHRQKAALWVLSASIVLVGACGPVATNPSPAADPATTTEAAGAPRTPQRTPAATTTVANPAGRHQPFAASGTALAALAALPVKGRAPKTGYSREQFGVAWTDVDRNGCDTRNDVLTRDLTARTYKPGTGSCLVLTGTLDDPYSGAPIDFTRGQLTSSAIQIDHVVALSDAWQTGAQQLTTERRTALANDPVNLLAVDGSLNLQKSDSDAASWLPPNKRFRCAYVARQVAVKSAYALWVTQAEHEAIERVLQSCPEQALPDGARPPAVAHPVPTSGPPAPLTPTPGPRNPLPGSTPFANCAAARAAGAAPVRRGEPGYSTKLDRDGDGIGCE